ncbi:MAG TPA: DUF5522 domain-containing protein [Acidimicrobiales bacterium]|nr:DUF5522 domain-containing protein [Acidimicrobiales bacterium]
MPGGSRPPDAEPLAPRPLTEPHPDRLAPDHPSYAAILEAHRAALRDGADMYVDPVSGLAVLTATYLTRRGTCCGSGCRHCPYVA